MRLANHGLRRSNADKRRAVLTLLNDEEWATWSDREIARQCAVGADMVGGLRKSYLSETTDAAPSATRTVSRSGKTYQQNTAAIGKAGQPAPLEDNPAVVDAMARVRRRPRRQASRGAHAAG